MQGAGLERELTQEQQSIIWQGCLHPTGHVHLTFDLLTGPPRGVESTLAILAGVSRVPDQGSNPFLAEEGSKLAVRESINQVTTGLVSKSRTIDNNDC